MRSSSSELKLFKDSSIYKDLVDDIQYQIQGLQFRLEKGGDKEISDDRIRGRLDFCRYFLSLVDDMIREAEEDEKVNKSDNTNIKEDNL